MDSHVVESDGRCSIERRRLPCGSRRHAAGAVLLLIAGRTTQQGEREEQQGVLTTS
jgi:hypothetical protein